MSKRFRTLIALATVAALVLSMAGLASAQFSDVKDDAPYAKHVELLHELGIAKGLPDGSYGVDQPMTREQFAVFVVRAMKKDSLAEAFSSYNTSFSDDASISSWARGHVYLATSLKIINGYPDGTFKPQGMVTHAEALTMLVRALGFAAYADGKGAWPANYIVVAEELGISDGLSVVPNLPMVRSEMATALFNTLNAPTAKNEDGSPDKSKPETAWIKVYWDREPTAALAVEGKVESVTSWNKTIVVAGRSFKYVDKGTADVPDHDDDTDLTLNDGNAGSLKYSDLKDKTVRVYFSDDTATRIDVLAPLADVFLTAVDAEDGTIKIADTVQGANERTINVTSSTELLLDGKKVSLAELQEAFEEFQDEWNDNPALVSVRVPGKSETADDKDTANWVSVITAKIVEGKITSTGKDTKGDYARIDGEKVYYKGLTASANMTVTWLLGSDDFARVALSESTTAAKFFAKVVEYSIDGSTDSAIFELADGSTRTVTRWTYDEDFTKVTQNVNKVVWVEIAGNGVATVKLLTELPASQKELGQSVTSKTSTYVKSGNSVYPLASVGVIVKKADGKFGSYADVKNGQTVDIYLTDEGEAGYIEIK